MLYCDKQERQLHQTEFALGVHSFLLLSINYKPLSMLLHLTSAIISWDSCIVFHITISLFAIINKALLPLTTRGKLGYLLMFTPIIPHVEQVLDKCILAK